MSSRDSHVSTRARTKCKKNYGLGLSRDFFPRSHLHSNVVIWIFKLHRRGGLFFRVSDGAFHFAILCLRMHKLIRGANILCSLLIFSATKFWQLRKLETERKRRTRFHLANLWPKLLVNLKGYTIEDIVKSCRVAALESIQGWWINRRRRAESPEKKHRRAYELPLGFFKLARMINRGSLISPKIRGHRLT